MELTASRTESLTRKGAASEQRFPLEFRHLDRPGEAAQARSTRRALDSLSGLRSHGLQKACRAAFGRVPVMRPPFLCVLANPDQAASGRRQLRGMVRGSVPLGPLGI